ncbi:AAA family ATPase [Xanthomonas hyacinthi]|uniref:ATP-dependent endonuclease n=1 Tax=Xanthomonas hyacinthi TaxID=56455 RepID=A0A2S7ENM9_9XANT|nr:ATP-dependent endonuclease [Xanthomonas hyacinthi]KLD76244.1 hypothetical protein Y886_22385 [Xanthomonas hyacinthi DSM 19077]PPU93229.1 ATP-dependent endonuclease [Xanthomonas hyacinthi]QGY77822.1 AAA family ATPase [Xanthomonas hyacinthi]
MRIKSIRIKNFRAFEDQSIELDDYSCFVGMNGAGKSTVLCALNVFFQEKANATDVQKLSAQDFHKKDTSKPVEIELTFRDLPQQAREKLADYVRNGELIVTATATYDAATGMAKVKQHGSRMGMAQFVPFFEAQGNRASAKELQIIYEGLRADFELPDAKSSDARADALRTYEAGRPELQTPLPSGDEFYGFSGSSKLRPFIQWVYVPAVKNAADEQVEGRDTALGALLARTVRAKLNFRRDVEQIELVARNSISALLNDSQGALDKVAQAITKRLTDWSHPDASVTLAWDTANVSVKEPSARAFGAESGFSGDFARFGHGFQRAYLLALLQEIAVDEDEAQPTLILGCEEPELYQHPPQARHLAALLKKLADGGAQILLTTHSPYFVSAENFESVRMVRRSDAQASEVASLTFARFAGLYAASVQEVALRASAVEAQLGECLRAQLNEMFFARKLVLVEGTEDVANIMTWLVLTGRLDDFRRKGLHLIPVSGKSSFLRPLLIAKGLGIPVLVIFDGDSQVEDNKKGAHKKDNLALLRALGSPAVVPFPEETVWGDGYIQWPNELSDHVTAELSASLGGEALARIEELSRNDCGQAKNLLKNSSYIQYRLKRAHEAGGRSETLDRVCETVVAGAW